ncbi:MAG: 50S ribosomal protein L25 [Clostridiaceae bacterium]|nr:50S ribosomal protein L25 [Clostridiaceae bacterium]
MYILKAEKRDPHLKPKQLRRAGYIPGVLYGGRNSEPLNIQFPQNEVERFLRSNSLGSKVELIIGDKKQMALLKEISYAPVGNSAHHLSFMPLVEGEKITNVAQIILLNKDMISGNVQQSLFEITYKAFPADLVDTIEINLEGKTVGDAIRVSDLEIVKNENIEILTPLDTMIYSIAPISRAAATPETDEDQEDTEEI